MAGRAGALPARAAAPAARPRPLWREIWRKRMLYLALTPTFALLSVFEYYPPLSAMYHAFFQWTGASDPKFVGLANFAELATDKVFWPSVANMLRVLVVHLAFQLTVPFLVAELLFHLRIERLSYLFRLLFVVPLVVPWIVSLLIWQFIYDPSVGLLNAILGAIGLDWLRGGWLGDPSRALWAYTFIGFPFAYPVYVLILLAGLQGITDSVHEAALMDGARGLRKMLSIDLPLVTGQLKLILILTVIQNVQLYGSVLVLTRGGPGYATMLPGLHMYLNAFEFSRMGYASAIGFVMFLVILGLTYVNMRYVKSSTEYEAT